MTKQQTTYDNVLAVSEGDTAFGFSIMPHLSKGNLTFSPYSIRTALAMVYEGARGVSAKEISDVAFIPENIESRLKGYNELMHRLNAKNESHVLKSANGLWVEKQFESNPRYRKTLRDSYQAMADDADFLNNAEYWRGEINEWVSDQTEKKIPELFPQGSISSDTVVALANALYFKGFWENKFDAELTQKQDYTLPGNQVVQVDMMRKGAVEREHKLPKFLYGCFDGFQVAMLPYKGRELKKAVMLAPKGSDISQLEEVLKQNPSLFRDWVSQLRESEFARLEIPKHEIRKGFSLNSPLQAMGIRRIFSNNADLSGIGEGPLFIGSGYHQAYFKTDEEGSEGAAATGFAVMRCAVFDKPKPVEFVADKPFLEMIVHQPTDALLFLNRIVDPR